jgi:anti-sigma factor RsiW
VKMGMKDDTPLLPGEAELHAWVDGRLDPARRAAVAGRLAVDADASQRAQAWAAQREALRALHADLLAEPVPEHLLQAADLLQQRSRRLAQWQRWGGMAASVLFAFALGWGGRSLWPDGGFGGAGARPTLSFAHQAAIAYAVYMPEVRHPVEVDASQQQHLVQWLS